MARKTHGTRQKMVFRVEATKPRNPLAVRARQRKAGSHEPGPGSRRQAAKRELRKKIEEE